MAGERAQRRLAAILAADVAGYSRLMGSDDEGTLAGLKACRELIDLKSKQHRGRIVNTPGDSALVEFASAVDAARCAMEIQKEMAERNAVIPEDRRIELRIGVNVGDVIVDDRGDIFGDGVNVAARLEGLAEPGGICVSSRVQEDAEGKLEVSFENAGEKQLKNIARPVRVYCVRLGGAAPSSRPALPLPDRPSIAVLPFQNMSGDPEQEYFADGIVEEIITALSRFKQLFVIARNSSFTYKGRAVDVKQVGRELGVRYVLEGSVRKTAGRLRITGQLLDATTGVHLWADRFDGVMGDVFDLQDQVSESVVGTITAKLEQAEIERAKRKRPESLDAYDCYLRGLASFHVWTREEMSEALLLFRKAIDLDPGFASAHAMAARCYLLRKNNGWMTEPAREMAEAERLAQRAVELGRDDADVLCIGGLVIARIDRHLHAGAALINRALILNPNLVTAWFTSGFVRNYLGEPELAIEHFMRAMRLSPFDPLVHVMYAGIAAAHFLAGRYDEASSWAEKALLEQPNFLPGMRMVAASHALAGRLGDAQEAMGRMRQIDPALRITTLSDFYPFRGTEDCARYAEGLRKAGLPE